jgi:hypothetical protein
MVTRCIREAVTLAWVVLWVLSTRVGTLLLCGRLCVSGQFPYVRKFADMPVAAREAALQRWNRVRWLFPLRIAFALVKIICHYVFYSMVRPQISLSALQPKLVLICLLLVRLSPRSICISQVTSDMALC